MLAIVSANIIWVLCVLFILFVLLLPAILCLLTADTEEEAKKFLTLDTFLCFYRNLSVKRGWQKRNNISYRAYAYGVHIDEASVDGFQLQLPEDKVKFQVNPFRRGVYYYSNACIVLNLGNEKKEIECDRITILCKPCFRFTPQYQSKMTIIMEKMPDRIFSNFVFDQ
jgi:hypothetical protein